MSDTQDIEGHPQGHNIEGGELYACKLMHNSMAVL